MDTWERIVLAAIIAVLLYRNVWLERELSDATRAWQASLKALNRALQIIETEKKA